MSDVYVRAARIIATHLDVEPDRVKLHATFTNDLGADSLDHVELLMYFEEEFLLEISDEEAETVKTVGDAVNLIEKKLETS